MSVGSWSKNTAGWTQGGCLVELEYWPLVQYRSEGAGTKVGHVANPLAVGMASLRQCGRTRCALLNAKGGQLALHERRSARKVVAIGLLHDSGG
jgi:hypothetical protein